MDRLDFNSQAILSPTSSLPPLGRIRDYSLDQVTRALHNLRELYFFPPPSALPQKLCAPQRNIERLIHDASVPDSGYASAEEEDDDEVTEESIIQFSSTKQINDEIEESSSLDVLRSDNFERSFAIKWLTGFVARSNIWVASAPGDGDDEYDNRAQVIDDVTTLLSLFSGDEDEAAGSVTRRFSFLREAGNRCIDVELNDAPLSGTDHTSVGLQSWGSSVLLAGKLCLAPSEFDLCHRECEDGLRVLELGAGTGLLSIAVAKLLSNDPEHKNIIAATDYHPDVLSNLLANVNTNLHPSSPPSGSIIHVLRLDWECPEFVAPLDKPFDVILAADVIYHPQHAQWIKNCVEQLLVLPPNIDGTGGGIFWMMIPVRSTGRHEGMADTVGRIFPDASTVQFGGLNQYQRHWTLAILAKEETGRKGTVGRADEGVYILFKIGWVLS